MRAVRSRSQARGTHLWTDAQGIRSARPGGSRVRVAGEDADPTYLTHPDGGRLLAVYDGMGGAGARVLLHSDGRAYSEAYFASRRVRTAVQEWFLGSPGTVELGLEPIRSRRMSAPSWPSCGRRTRSCGWSVICSNDRWPSG